MIRVGEKLKQERLIKALTIAEVAKQTKIRPQFIEAIEKGNYALLPGGSYAQGFVKNYVEYLGLPTKEFMALFRREFNEKEYLGVLPESFIEKEKIPLHSVRISRTLIGIVLLLLVISFYIFFQYRSAVFNPNLSLTSPADKITITTQTVLVRGTTDPNSSVTVNNLPTFVDGDGHFTKEIPVFPGNIVITVKSMNSFGRVSSINRQIQVTTGK